jgi:two-component system chemotaxis sensor kinase CheA
VAAEDLELQRAFFLESTEILNRMEGDLLSWRSQPSDAAILNALFRSLHTIKGNSSFLDMPGITKLSHAAETMLDKARKGELAVAGSMQEITQRVVEELRSMIEDQNLDLDIQPTVQAIQNFLAGGAAAPAPETAAPKETLPTVPSSALPGAPPAAKVFTGNFTRVDDGKIAKILSVASELELLRYSLELVPEKMEAFGPQLADLRFEVDLQVSKLTRLSRHLSSLVFGVRLVPVNNVFQRFPRVVQDLGAKLGKEIKLSIVNGGAEMDKAIVEAITEPMTHLIRNSVDHGIESAAERVALGKAPQGTIRLNSFVRANFVFIEISDDGRGIDGDKILAKAVEKGIVPAEKAPSFTEAQKLSLIFAPGFSTAEKVTDISGRGVGMDVVKSNINQLKGTVILDSKVGQGTRIQLRFPMSMAVLFSLFVQVGETQCSLPVEQVDESMDYFPSELLREIPEGEDRRDYLALHSVRALLWNDAHSELDSRRAFHTLRFKDAPCAAFIVEEFASIEEAIVQSIDSYIAALPGLQGATIRKDGSVALVLNAQSIQEIASKSKPLAYVKKRVATEEDPSMLAPFPKS